MLEMTPTHMSLSRPHTVTSALVLSLTTLLPSWSASAEEGHAQVITEWFPYVVKQPQKLSHLLDTLTLPKDTAQALQTLQDHNQPLDLNQLQPGQTIRLPRNWLRQDPIPLKVTRIRCTGKAEPTTATQQPLYPGMSLGEGNIINVPGGCQVSLSLRDGSQLQLPSSSVVQIDTLREQPDLKQPQVKLKLLQGKISLNIFKKRSPETRFEVETPRATTGVRGTEFRVSHDTGNDTSTVEVLEGEVQTHAQNSAQTEAIQANQGALIDGTGHIEIESLPPPPSLALEGRTWTWQNTQPELRYRRQDLQAINEAAMWEPPQATPGASIIFHNDGEAKTSTTRIVQAAAITPSGLMGAWATFAMCTSASTQPEPLCPVRFQLDSIDETLTHLDVRKTNATASSRWISTKTGNPSTREVVTLLPPGHYAWQLKRKTLLPTESSTEQTIAQGQFTLIDTRSAHP